MVDLTLAAPYCNSNRIGVIILDAIALSICFFVLSVVCVTGWITIRKINRQKKVRQSLKYTLYTAISSAFLVISFDIIFNVVCMSVSPRFGGTAIIWTFGFLIAVFSYCGLYLCLLINLFIRLDVTFCESALAMSATKRRVYLTFIFLEIILFVVSIGITAVIFQKNSIILGHMSIIIVGLAAIIYLLLSFALVGEFINNLTEMAKFSVGPSQNASNLILNNSQIQKVNLSAKYLALYFIAQVMTLFCAACAHVSLNTPFDEGHQTRWSLVAIDVCVNICCLVLSYAVMGSAYTKYCHHIDGCCKKLTTGLMKKRVRQILDERNSNQSTEETHVAESDVLLMGGSASDLTDGSTSL